MLFALAASLLLHLPDGSAEELPVAMALDEPPANVRSWEEQQEDAPQRPRSWGDAQLRRIDDDLWTLTLAPTLRLIGGKTRVRELSSKPIWLDLGESDFGFGPAAGIQLTFKYETRTVAWFLDVDLTHAQGQGKFQQDFAYDEGNFVAAIPYRTHADLVFARAGMVLPGLIWQSRDTRISPLLGLEYPLINVGIDQSATGQSTAEQFKQFVPVPFAGVAMEQRLSSAFTLSGRFYVGGVPDMPTPFLEGGRLYMRILTLRSDLEFSWQVSDSIRIFAPGRCRTRSGSSPGRDISSGPAACGRSRTATTSGSQRRCSRSASTSACSYGNVGRYGWEDEKNPPLSASAHFCAATQHPCSLR
jgi:hypothetical protein